MSQTQQYTDGLSTIKEVVKKSLWAAKKPRSKYFLFLELAIDAYRELRLHAVTEGKTWKKCTVDSIGCIDFPEEFEDFIGIYVPLNGELWPLTRRDSIITTTSLSGVTEIQDSTKGEGEEISHTPYTDAGGQNTKGYYTIDWDERRIFLNKLGDATEVILLYKSSGTKINVTTWIPNKYIPCMIAKIMFAFVQYDDNANPNRRMELQANLQQEEIKLRNLESPTLDEFMDAIYSTYYLTPKR